MEKKQFNIRLGKESERQLDELVRLYGTKTTVVTVAIDKLYTEKMQDTTRKNDT